MSDIEEVWLAIPVKVQGKLDIDLAHYLERFLEIGFEDLNESVNDNDIESDADDEILLEKTTWGIPIVLKEKPQMKGD